MAIQYSIQKMVSDGTLSTIALGIQYLQRNDIYIRIAGEETPQSGAPSGYTWSFVNNTTLKILPVVPNGVEVVVYRRTDVDAMYNIYSQNAQFDEATIDENNQQLLYIAQEYLEQGIPGAGVDTIEFLRDDGINTYYRIKRTDGSYSNEFSVPSAGSVTKIVAREALRRSYAEAGYNLVDGSFEVGGVLVDANDVLLQERTGKAFSGPAGTVAAGTNPSSGGFVDRSGTLSVVAIRDIATLRATEPLFDGQRIPVIGYYDDTPLQGGGDFIYDSTDTTTPDDGVLTFVTAGGRRWKRKNPNRLGRLSALDAGARADSQANLDTMTNLGSGTNNSVAQVRADNAAALLGCRVHWPDGKYRFAQALQRKVIHEGNYTYAAGGTTFILDNASATTWLLPIPGRSDNRSQDVDGVWFVAAQLHVHRLFSAGFYRGSIDNCRVSRFDIGFDIDGVYVWFKKVYFDNNNKGVYPRALGGTVGAGNASTMFGFEDCVFFQNSDVGFLHEVRPEGVDAAAKELLNVQFVRCGFEYNQRGLVMTGRCWYVGLVNCWSEGNSVIGVNITNAFTDVYEMGCRWDDATPPVFPQNRRFRWSSDGLMVNATRKTNYRNVNNVIENKSSSFIVKQDGTILNNSGLPVVASIAVDNTLALTFTGDLNQPLITVTPVIRNQYLSYSLSFDNTGGVALPGDNNRVNIVRVRCFEPAAPATIVRPLWWNITVAWPSNMNT